MSAIRCPKCQGEVSFNPIERLANPGAGSPIEAQYRPPIGKFHTVPCPHCGTQILVRKQPLPPEYGGPPRPPS